MDWLSSPMELAGAIMVGVLAVSVVSRRWQRCPRRNRLVPRAARAAALHRSVHLRR